MSPDQEEAMVEEDEVHYLIQLYMFPHAHADKVIYKHHSFLFFSFFCLNYLWGIIVLKSAGDWSGVPTICFM